MTAGLERVIEGVRQLELFKIRQDGGTQSRTHISPEAVSDYAEAMGANAPFPPVTVFFDGNYYWLADGFHRLEAARRNGFIQILAEIKRGSRRDAILYSVGSNATHGLRRTTSDKRRAVEMLLRDLEWRQWSDREIARRAAVTHPFVAKVRLREKELTAMVGENQEEYYDEGRYYTTRHGTTSIMRMPAPSPSKIFGTHKTPRKLQQRHFVTPNQTPVQRPQESIEDLKAKINAVLAMREASLVPGSVLVAQEWVDGYNECLSNVKEMLRGQTPEPGVGDEKREIL